jgi:hypothetical protein
VVPINKARLLYAIIKKVPFCMVKHIILTMFELQQDSQVSLPYGGLVTKILKSKLTSIPANEPEDMPDGTFGKQTVLKSNTQLQRHRDLDELIPPAHATTLVASSSRSAPASDSVVTLFTRLANQLTRGFQSADEGIAESSY